MPQVFTSADELRAAIGQPLPPSPWLAVTQERVNTFADATDDHQWIHVDAERAQSGPFGGTIAHGYLTLSLAARFMPEILDIRMKMGVNIGCDKVRFLSPVKVADRIRGVGEILSIEPTKDGGVQSVLRLTIEIDGGSKPACVADTVSRYYF
jgi:acyl dehydratase